MSAERAVLIVNPTARRASAALHADVLSALRARWRIDVVAPASPQDSAAAARDAVGEGYDAVLAAGGDGTASAVASGMAGAATAFGLVPAGTANDFARALGIPRAPVAAARALAAATALPTDVLRVGDRCVCTVIGVGIVADSALAAARLRASRGPARALARAAGASIYRATATAALLRRHPLSEPIELRLEGADGAIRSVAHPSPGLFVAAQPFLGGGLRLPGVATAADGLAEALVVQDVSRLRLVDAFARLTLGLPIPSSALAVHRVRRVEIHTARPQTIIGDGDAVATGDAFEIAVLPGGLRVLRGRPDPAQPTRNSSSERA